MAVNEHEDTSQYVPQPSFLTKLFRERGTIRIVIGALALFAVWYVYSTIQSNLVLSKKWPPLAPDAKGLTVLGLRDHERPGWHRQYEAIESGHQWRIRRPDDAQDQVTPSEGETRQGARKAKGASGSGDDEEEAKERGNDPGATHRVNRGEVVDVAEVMRTCPVVMTGAQFTSASYDKKIDSFGDRPYCALHLNLTDEGRSRYYQFAHDREGERLVFVLDGQIITCPKMAPMNVSSLDIDPIWDEADAKRLADYINAHPGR